MLSLFRLTKKRTSVATDRLKGSSSIYRTVSARKRQETKRRTSFAVKNIALHADLPVQTSFLRAIRVDIKMMKLDAVDTPAKV